MASRPTCLGARPTVVSIIHSFSAADPLDPSTIAGRWLENGVYIYFGAMNEPYLNAFRCPKLDRGTGLHRDAFERRAATGTRRDLRPAMATGVSGRPALSVPPEQHRPPPEAYASPERVEAASLVPRPLDRNRDRRPGPTLVTPHGRGRRSGCNGASPRRSVLSASQTIRRPPPALRLLPRRIHRLDVGLAEDRSPAT